MILYYAPTACSLAPHIAIEEIGADFEPRAIDLAKGEQTSPEYLKINPRGRVPAMIIDGAVVTEVPALLTYIAGLKPEARLVPATGTLPFARCFEWLAFLSSSVHIAYAQFRRPVRFVPADSPASDEVSRHGKEHCIALYREVDSRLGSGWAAGEHYSIADCYLLPFYVWAWRLDLDMPRDCPNWTAWAARMADRPAVQRALQREGLTL